VGDARQGAVHGGAIQYESRLGHKKAESTRCPGRFDNPSFKVHFSFATSQDRFKGRNGCAPPLMVRMAAFAPFGPVLDDPIGQGPFKSNIVASLLRFDPFVLHDLLALRLELAVQRRFLDQIVAI
jgi:hypothetical protein